MSRARMQAVRLSVTALSLLGCWRAAAALQRAPRLQAQRIRRPPWCRHRKGPGAVLPGLVPTLDPLA